MVETLLVGDHLLASKFAYGIKVPFTHSYLYRGNDPVKGDVIIFEYPNDPSVDYIKRIVGTPGDTIEVRNKQLFRNGEPVKESYIHFTEPDRIMQGLMDSVMERLGSIDYLVNNAGVTGPHGVSICDYDVDDWQDVIQTDLSGVFYGMKYAIPAMLKNGGGAILNLSAVNGVVGIPGIAPYTCAKHGFFRQFAHLIGHHGKAAPRVASPGGLNGGVEGQQVGLVRDVFNGLGNSADGIGLAAEVVHRITGRLKIVVDGAHVATDGGKLACALFRRLARFF
jgi:signal peptidase I, bacterial type